jgi:predicted membrane protein
MADNRTSFFDTKIIIGLVILIFGILLFLRNLGYDIGMSLWSYWPIILIILGLRIMIQPRENRQLVTGAILVLVGALLILHNLRIIHFGWGIIWPIIIILIGISIIVGHFKHSGKLGIAKDRIDLSMVMGGGEFRFDSHEFKGGRITAIMGGGTVDLRDADMVTDEIVIDIFALMGGIEFWVPTSWQVVMHGTPILGGMENKAVSRVSDIQSSKPKRLIITGMAVMGGVEVKN